MRLISTRRLEERLAFIRCVGVEGIQALVEDRLGRGSAVVGFNHPSFDPPMLIRVPSTDFKVCRQWVDSASPEKTVEGCRLVVDAGANIGASSRMLMRRFPGARVIAIELETTNFAMLERNVTGYERIEARHCGLWDRSGHLSVESDSERSNWGFRGRLIDQPTSDSGVAAVTIDSLLEESSRIHGVERIDVLKMDIEGGELPVMSNCRSWIDRVDSIMIELHESTAPGATAAFDAATVDFPVRWAEGELQCRARAHAAILDAKSLR